MAKQGKFIRNDDGSVTFEIDEEKILQSVERVKESGDKPEQAKTVDLSMSSGNQVINPDTGKTLSKVTVRKPATLVASNIKEGIDIGGITGTVEEGLPTETKTITLDLASGNQVVNATSGYTMNQVTVTKPATLVATNIKKDINIAGVVGTYEGGSGTDYLPNRIANNSSNPYSYSNSDITQIRNYAFYQDTNLISINLSNITSTGQYAFQSCSNLVSVNFPKVTNVSTTSFKDCTNLETVTLSTTNSVELSSLNAFSGCSKLVTVNAKLRDLRGNNLFENCSSLKNIDLTFLGYGNIGTVIGQKAFSGCSGLDSVLDLGWCKTLDKNSFAGCSSLPGIIANSLTTINAYVFYQCTSLTDITLGNNAVCTLGNVNAFGSIGHQVTIHVPSDLITSYQEASNWSTLYNNGDVTFVAISE